jgi:hypothetical protein
MPYLTQWASIGKVAADGRRHRDVWKTTTGDAQLDAALKHAARKASWPRRRCTS